VANDAKVKNSFQGKVKSRAIIRKVTRGVSSKEETNAMTDKVHKKTSEIFKVLSQIKKK
jgi:hypothetical protein